MYTAREYDIMLVEAEYENQKLIDEVGLEMLGKRAKRMMQNAENDGRRWGASNEAAPGAEPSEAGGANSY
jgi:hypothetical protein